VAVSSSKKSLFGGWRGQNAAKKKVRGRKSKNAQAFANDSNSSTRKSSRQVAKRAVKKKTSIYF
jgi:hypothetical protein